MNYHELSINFLINACYCHIVYNRLKYNGKERQFYTKGASRIKPLATSMECDDYNYLVSTNSADLLNISEFVNSKMHKLSQKIGTILK